MGKVELWFDGCKIAVTMDLDILAYIRAIIYSLKTSACQNSLKKLDCAPWLYFLWKPLFQATGSKIGRPRLYTLTRNFGMLGKSIDGCPDPAALVRHLSAARLVNFKEVLYEHLSKQISFLGILH